MSIPRMKASRSRPVWETVTTCSVWFCLPSPADTVMVAVRDDPLKLVSAVIVSPCSVFVAESQSEFSESVYSQS